MAAPHGPRHGRAPPGRHLGAASSPAGRGSPSCSPTSTRATWPSGWTTRQLEELAAEHGVEIATHRDATRSIYLAGPGSLQTEIIAYPPGA